MSAKLKNLFIKIFALAIFVILLEYIVRQANYQLDLKAKYTDLDLLWRLAGVLVIWEFLVRRRPRRNEGG